MVKQAPEVWLRTDEIGELIDALEHCAEIAPKVSTSIPYWKWLILALHHALQGACTCALRGHDTSALLVLTQDTAKELYDWLEATRANPDAPKPKEKLATMLDLYKRTRRNLLDPHKLPADAQRDADVRKLNELRNMVSHFIPTGWSLEVSGLPRITRHCCDAIEHLCVHEPTFWHHLKEAKRKRIQEALASIRHAMNLVEAQYAERALPA